MQAGLAAVDELRAVKQDYLRAVHRILSIHLGTPPEKFAWQWRETGGTFHRTEEMTPLQFAEEFVNLPLDDYVCLVHDPRPGNPFGRTYTVEYLGIWESINNADFNSGEFARIKSQAGLNLKANV